MRHLLLIIALLSLSWTGVHFVLGESPESVTQLEPGENYVGWIGDPISPSELFRAVPAAQSVYVWDAQAGHFRLAAPQFLGNLDLIEPGMAVLIRIGGSASVDWHRVAQVDGDHVLLHAGWNLVAWTGPDATPLGLATRSVGRRLERVTLPARSGTSGRSFDRTALSDWATTPLLNRGDALWVRVRRSGWWLQPSGDRPLHGLYAPPPVLALDPFYTKHLDADGLAIVSSANTDDETLFRVAAIIDDVLANREDIRERLVARGVYVAISAESERVNELPEFRDLFDGWSTRSPSLVLGLGPSGNTPMYVSERLVYCTDWAATELQDVVVHETAHAIEFAFGDTPEGEILFRTRDALFQADREAGRYESTYRMTNASEYWAVAVQTWFGLSTPSGHFMPNHVDTRGELREYSPVLAALIEKTFGETEVTSSCFRVTTEHDDLEFRRVLGTLRDSNGEPMEGIVFRPKVLPRDPEKDSVLDGVYDHARFNTLSSGYGRGSDESGMFSGWVIDGQPFALQFSNFVGDCYIERVTSENGLVMDIEQATVYTTTGVDLHGIEVSLSPDDVELLRRAGC